MQNPAYRPYREQQRIAPPKLKTGGPQQSPTPAVLRPGHRVLQQYRSLSDPDLFLTAQADRTIEVGAALAHRQDRYYSDHRQQADQHLKLQNLPYLPYVPTIRPHTVIQPVIELEENAPPQVVVSTRNDSTATHRSASSNDSSVSSDQYSQAWSPTSPSWNIAEAFAPSPSSPGGSRNGGPTHLPTVLTSGRPRHPHQHHRPSISESEPRVRYPADASNDRTYSLPTARHPLYSPHSQPLYKAQHNRTYSLPSVQESPHQTPYAAARLNAQLETGYTTALTVGSYHRPLPPQQQPALNPASFAFTRERRAPARLVKRRPVLAGSASAPVLRVRGGEARDPWARGGTCGEDATLIHDGGVGTGVSPTSPMSSSSVGESVSPHERWMQSSAEAWAPPSSSPAGAGAAGRLGGPEGGRYYSFSPYTNGFEPLLGEGEVEDGEEDPGCVAVAPGKKKWLKALFGRKRG